MNLTTTGTLLAGFLVVGVLQPCHGVEVSSAVSNAFDVNTGANTYLGPFVGTPYGLNNANWAAGETGITRNAGSQAFMSANGNQATDFAGDGLRKALGGVVSPNPYAVSFYVATYLSLEGVELSDFTSLRIGGPSGSMQWVSTPKPTINGQWLKWSGVYTPSPSDVGQPFAFEAIWNLDARHAIALDGPIVAMPIPEPGSVLLANLGMVALTCRRAWRGPRSRRA